MEKIKSLLGFLTNYQRKRDALKCLLLGRFNLGACPVCEHKTIFLKRGPWLRGFYNCLWCDSVPRQRALLAVLNMIFPDWRDKSMHESSPFGATSWKLRRECGGYSASHFWPEIEPGQTRDGVRCENLEKMTFADNSFNLIITQDVLEHVLEPGRAFSEVARVLKKGGAHVFTVPYYYWNQTLVRAEATEQGINYLEEKDYHGNPVDPNGSLVVREWGYDITDFIHQHSGLSTTVYQLRDSRRGLDGEFLEVFVSRKL